MTTKTSEKCMIQPKHLFGVDCDFSFTNADGERSHSSVTVYITTSSKNIAQAIDIVNKIFDNKLACNMQQLRNLQDIKLESIGFVQYEHCVWNDNNPLV